MESTYICLTVKGILQTFLFTTSILFLPLLAHGMDVPCLSTHVSLTVSAVPVEGGTVSPSGTHCFIKGQTVSISAAASPGYFFNGWSGDLTGASNPKPIRMDRNKNVTANFGRGPDLSGSWTTPVMQTCRNTNKGPRCTVSGTLAVNNIGDRETRPSHVGFYLSNDHSYNGTDIRLKILATGKIKAGMSKSINPTTIHMMSSRQWPVYVSGVRDKHDGSLSVSMRQVQ